MEENSEKLSSSRSVFPGKFIIEESNKAIQEAEVGTPNLELEYDSSKLEKEAPEQRCYGKRTAIEENGMNRKLA